MSEHLTLPFYTGEFERRKPEVKHGFKARDDRKAFADVQVYSLAQIKGDFDKDKGKFKTYFDPRLIFRIEVNQSVPEEDYTKFLERAGVKVISPSPLGKGYWISLAEDETLDTIKNRLQQYGVIAKYKGFDAIESFSTILPEEKIGDQLKGAPLEKGEEAYLDIEIWRMEDDKLQSFLDGFQKLVEAGDGQITDKLVTESLCLLRARIKYSLLNEIIKLREISRIDRPPKPYISLKMLSVPLEKLQIEGSPAENAAAIVVLDSGILSNHPLLENAIGDEISVPLLDSGKISPDKPQDDVGHGTKVAGLALYGDIKACIENKIFKPEVWILSAKVMFKEEDPAGNIRASYDESELLEHQLEKAVTYFTREFNNCKVINISFGDTYKKMFGNKRQFPLATLVDELARKLNVVFVISTGNIDESVISDTEYPHHLLEEKETVKIIDPGSSAYALTVGAIAQKFGPSDVYQSQMLISPAKTNYPSPFTCVGPGYRGMIKPDLVEEGGNIISSPSDPAKLEDIGGKLVVLNPDWIHEGKLFALDYGTSFSAPKVSHLVAKLFNSFPDSSPNLIKALLLASAEIPSDRPSPLSEIKTDDSDKNLMELLKIYGYGKPSYDVAVSSEYNRVILKAENRIKPDSVHLYYFYLPAEFVETKGNKEISVCLVYNPPVRRNRVDYMGVNFEFHLFRDSDISEVLSGYKKIKIERESEEIVPEGLKLREIDLHPGVRMRKKSIHQKGTKPYLGQPRIDPDKPLVLAIVCQDRWIRTEDFQQDYAIVVTVKHQAMIDIYTLIKQRVEIEERIRIRT
jgi:subtilisin family serine protease